MVQSKKVFHHVSLIICLLIVALTLMNPTVSAQDKKPSFKRRSRSAPAAAPQAASPQPAPAKPAAAKAAESKKDEKQAEKPAEKSKVETIQRPEKPSEPANADELKLLPDKDGKIRFNFKGQPWVDVLQRLADISGMSLDWQEVPAKTVDLTTRQAYSIDEARDLINRLLLDRGFTLIRKGEVLSVVNLKNLDPGALPRVEPDELVDRDSHEFVKVSFPLDTLLAEEAAKEFETMRSPHGKLTPLKTTNRLEAMDVVTNLREIYRLIQREQSATGQERLIANFPLTHVRAADIKTKLEALLGIEKKSNAPMTPQQMQAAQRAAQQAQQKGKGAPTKKEVKIHIVANERDNSILVNAPADKIAIVKQAILLLDRSSEKTSFSARMQGIRVYRLSGLDPETFVKTLEKQGDLNPKAQLDVDKENNAVIAFASLIDHGKIKMMVDALDGSGRRFKVIRLRNLPSDYVAGTLKHMITGEEEGNKNRRSRYSFYSSYGSSRESTKKPDKFRVDADVENNRLVLWANDVEMKLVEDFLIELGEIPPRDGNRNTIRMIEIAPGEETEELLRRLKQAWPSFGPNQLQVAPAPEAPPKKEEDKQDQQQKEPEKDTRARFQPRQESLPPRKRVASAPHPLKESSQAAVASPAAEYFALAQLEKSSPENSSQEEPTGSPRQANPAPQPEDSGAGEPQSDSPSQPVPTPSPIRITRSPKGGLIIESDDTRALDLLEQLVAEIAPPPRDFISFHLKHADSWWISNKLEDYFKEEDDKKSSRNDYFYSWYYGMSSDSGKDTTRRLSKRKPLKFISESDTNTIIVQGGDASQLATVEKLLEIWDRPEPTDTQSARKSKVIKIKYSNAKVVAETVKEVYRDLLSSNDKSLQSGGQSKDKKPTADRIYTYIDTGGGDDKRSPVRFKGLLSIGIDQLSNTLVISSPEGLMKSVTDIITDLDEAAKPSSTVQVLQVNRKINSAMLQKKLAEVFAKRPLPGSTSPQQPGKNANGANQGKSANGSK